MRERPILFSMPMVQAILDGRKTMTRRVMKPQPIELLPPYPQCSELKCLGQHHRSPYGQVGSKLWVRETFAEVGSCDPGLIVYKASYPEYVPSHYENIPDIKEIKWKPSIFMRREHSRITLEITNIRVERLQDITEEDAIREGVEIAGKIKSSGIRVYKNYYLPDNPFSQAKHSFQYLWDSINGKSYPWASNPFVWVIEFERLP